jgi:hypothetical protein
MTRLGNILWSCWRAHSWCPVACHSISSFRVSRSVAELYTGSAGDECPEKHGLHTIHLPYVWLSCMMMTVYEGWNGLSHSLSSPGTATSYSHDHPRDPCTAQ